MDDRTDDNFSLDNCFILRMPSGTLPKWSTTQTSPLTRNVPFWHHGRRTLAP